MITIQIAPHLHEINIEGNVVECEFNEMKIKWILLVDGRELNEATQRHLKKSMQSAIGLSSKSWQIKEMLKSCVNCYSTVNITKIDKEDGSE